MNDMEIQSLLEDAGYRYDTASGQFLALGAHEDDEAFNPDEVADELEIPLDDLVRWQEEQGHADDASLQ